jgi:hypothetical protein
MPIGTGSFPSALEPGIKKWYGDEYAEYKPEYQEIFKTVPANKRVMTVVGQVGSGYSQIKSEGQPMAFDTIKEGYRHQATMVAYALGFVITWEEMRDNLYVDYGKSRTQIMTLGQRQVKDVVGANLLNRATNSAFTSNPGDGKQLAANDHPLVRGGTGSNVASSSVPLTEMSLEQAAIDIEGFKSDASLIFKYQPRKLVVPRQLRYKAHRVLDSILQSNTANNDINVLKSLNTFSEGICVNHFLDNSDEFYILTNVKGDDGLVYYERDPEMMELDNEPTTKNLLVMFYSRFAFNWGDWRSIYVVPSAS